MTETDAAAPRDPFPAEPQLRLDPEGHTAAIIRIDCDRAGRWLVSGAHDKTVKVWRIADGRLARTLRLPLGPGDLGKVYAVAISPDGALVAAGGWLGPANEDFTTSSTAPPASCAARWAACRT